MCGSDLDEPFRIDSGQPHNGPVANNGVLILIVDQEGQQRIEGARRLQQPQACRREVADAKAWISKQVDECRSRGRQFQFARQSSSLSADFRVVIDEQRCIYRRELLVRGW